MSDSFRQLFMIILVAVLLTACGEDDSAAPPATPPPPTADSARPTLSPPATAEDVPVPAEAVVPPPSALSHPVVYQEEIYKNWPDTSPPAPAAPAGSSPVASQPQAALPSVEEKVATAVEEKIDTAATVVAQQAGAGAAAGSDSPRSQPTASPALTGAPLKRRRSILGHCPGSALRSGQ